MRIRRAITTGFAALALAVSSLVVTPSPASAATGGCYGAGCNNLNPAGRCDGDAFTVAAMGVTDGMLELRYSPSCVANWGRYTPYTRTASYYASQGKGIWARVTSWNPGGPSYGTAHHANSVYGSSWSKMTDGRYTACTGVEVFITGSNGDAQSQGWDWGAVLLIRWRPNQCDKGWPG